MIAACNTPISFRKVLQMKPFFLFCSRQIWSARHAVVIAALLSGSTSVFAQDGPPQRGPRGGDRVERGPRGGGVENRGPGQRGPGQRGPEQGDLGRRGPGDAGPRDAGPEGFMPQRRGPGGFGGPGGPQGARGGFNPQNGRPGMGFDMMTRMIPVLAALDADKDGVISAAEIDNASAALRKLDRNRDGKLAGEELRPMMGQRGGSDRRPAGPGGTPRPEGAGPQGRGPGAERGEFMGRMFTARDADKDGVLRGDEIPEQMAARLERIDQDGDAAISREELKQMMERMREAGQNGGRPGRGAGRPGDAGSRPGGAVPKRPGSDE